jgi:hypothetical protein
MQSASASNVQVLAKHMQGSGSDSSEAPAAPALAEPTGFGTLKGRFKLIGTPPERSPLRIDKEQDVCAPGGKTVLEESLVVSGDGGIRDVAVFLVMPSFPTGDEKWEHPDYAAKREAQVVFDQKQCLFLSHMFIARASQVIEIKNSDPIGHNTKIEHETPFNSTIPSDSRLPYKPVTPSSAPVPVSCSIHPWMSANMMFSNTPIFAVSAEDGTFEIANVPAGVELTFRAWQERAKVLPQVTLNGKQENWKKGFKVTLEPDQTLELNVDVDASVFQK